MDEYMERGVVALERVADSLEEIIGMINKAADEIPDEDETEPFVESQESIELKIIREQEGPEVFGPDDPEDVAETYDDRYPCPNCNEIQDCLMIVVPDELDIATCKECHHTWTPRTSMPETP